MARTTSPSKTHEKTSSPKTNWNQTHPPLLHSPSPLSALLKHLPRRPVARPQGADVADQAELSRALLACLVRLLVAFHGLHSPPGQSTQTIPNLIIWSNQALFRGFRCVMMYCTLCGLAVPVRRRLFKHAGACMDGKRVMKALHTLWFCTMESLEKTNKNSIS